jgi:hypothetical protein
MKDANTWALMPKRIQTATLKRRALKPKSHRRNGKEKGAEPEGPRHCRFTAAAAGRVSPAVADYASGAIVDGASSRLTTGREQSGDDRGAQLGICGGEDPRLLDRMILHFLEL